ncbi:MAG: Transcriptional regulator, TetR family [Frankiales bacterium]|nr:Transcriptional regulator, TetR family [Frankiales bacterium]
MSVQPARTTRTQTERSAAMQKRLLDATVSALNEKGYGGTTTMEVQQRAGVSRGALLHHFASRTDLMVAAVEHLTRERIGAVVALAKSQAPTKGRTQWAVTVLWGTFQGALYAASLELWLAARNDHELLTALLPQERIVGHAIRSMAADLFGPEVSGRRGFAEALELLLDAQRGGAARSVLRSANTDERMIASWVHLVEQLTA